jgi:hypothetical protein
MHNKQRIAANNSANNVPALFSINNPVKDVIRKGIIKNFTGKLKIDLVFDVVSPILFLIPFKSHVKNVYTESSSVKLQQPDVSTWVSANTDALYHQEDSPCPIPLRFLHSLVLGNAKVFLRRGERIGVNTAVHIVLDSSGSMCGTKMDLANPSCFAVASALHGIKGVSLGVTAFPGENIRNAGYPGQQNEQTVAPVLRHNQKIHTEFKVYAGDGTPMDAALWWGGTNFLETDRRLQFFIVTPPLIFLVGMRGFEPPAP